jgi:para-aminobenzoate synthetase component 1
MGLKRISLAYRKDVASRLGRLKDRPWFIYLDSCRDGCAGGRYDLIACDPLATVVTRGAITTTSQGAREAASEGDPFEILQAELARLLPPTGEGGIFTGGALGYFAYDLGRRIEPLPAHAIRDLDMPEMAIGLYGWAIVVDHELALAELVIHPAASCDEALVRRAWDAQPPVTPAAFGSVFEVTSQAGPELSFAQYAESWQRIKRYLREGDVYQVNLTQRFSASVRGDAWDAYQRLRTINPAPYSAYLALPDGEILSSSPERFIGVAANSVETRPIKGTRPRGRTPEEDRALAAELAVSSKDRAENVMIVDLLRNDLGKHSVIGSVQVPQLFAVESFAKVHHLVSTVRAELAAGVSPLTVLRDCFPGGSITGAPKLRAMEVIEELEPQRRSVYCGAIGYLAADGRMDTNIAIRTLLCHGGRMYCWAGGGIVMDSELDAEYAESLAKASAMLEVFARAELAHVGHQGRR